MWIDKCIAKNQKETINHNFYKENATDIVHGQ